MASPQGVQSRQARTQRLLRDTEVDEGDDLVGARRGHRVHHRPDAVRRADQGALVAVAAVGPAEHRVQVVLAEFGQVDAVAEAVGDAAEDGQRRAHVPGQRLVRLRPRGVVVVREVGVQQDRHASGVRVQAVPGPGAAVTGDVLAELLHALRHQVGDDAEVVAGGELVRGGVADHRRVQGRGVLHGSWEQPHLGLAVPAGPAQGVAAPEPAYLCELFVHQLLVPAETFGEEDEVLGAPAGGDADADASAGEVVDHRPLLGDPDGVVQGQDDGARVEPDAFGLAGQRGGEHRRVGEQAAEGVEVAFGHPQRVEPVAVGEPGDVHEQFVLAVAGRGRALRVVAEEVDAEVGGARGLRTRRGRAGSGDRRRVPGHGRHGCGGRGLGDRRLDRRRDRHRLRLHGSRRGRCRLGRHGSPAGEEPRGPQFAQRVAYGVRHELDVAVGVGGGQEEVAPLPDVHTAQHQVVVEEFQVGAVLEAELRAEVRHPQRVLLGLEEAVECRGEFGGAGGEPVLEVGAVLLEVGEHGARGDHRDRVLDVRTAEEGGVGGRVAVVAVGPVAAVDAVHDVGAAGDGPDGEAAAEELAVGGEVGGDAVQLLSAAQGGAEAGEHLVEEQDDAVAAGQLPQPAHELHRLERGVSALHRLHDDRGDLTGLPFDGFEGAVAAVVQDQQIGDG